MPIATTDLVCYAAANMPDADTGTNGGAVDTLRFVDFTQLAANDDLEVISTSASDTQNCTITARNAAGSVVTETRALTGTTAAVFSTLGVVERVLAVELASAAVGTVTVRRSPAGATLRTIPVGKRGFMALFRKAASDPSVQKDYFAKVFWRNEHATLALLSATVKQAADPDARITHLLAAAVNDTATTANRLTAPAVADTQDPDTFDDTDKAVPGTDLAAGAAIGVWLRLRLPAADSPHRTTYDTQLTGQSV
jgi:hypothetical protein